MQAESDSGLSLRPGDCVQLDSAVIVLVGRQCSGLGLTENREKVFVVIRTLSFPKMFLEHLQKIAMVSL